MINKSIVWIYVSALLILCMFFTSFGVSAREPDLSIQDTAYQSTFKPFGITRQSQLRNSIEEYKKSNEELPGEKIFLHTDRPGYLQGDTIWFKAYSWYGTTRYLIRQAESFMRIS